MLFLYPAQLNQTVFCNVLMKQHVKLTKKHCVTLQVVRALSFLQKGRDSSQDKWEAVTILRGTLQVYGVFICLHTLSSNKFFVSISIRL